MRFLGQTAYGKTPAVAFGSSALKALQHHSPLLQLVGVGGNDDAGVSLSRVTDRAGPASLAATAGSFRGFPKMQLPMGLRFQLSSQSEADRI